jgi:hypothetical protein
MARAPAGRTTLRGVWATGSYQVTFVRLACLSVAGGSSRQVRFQAQGRWITGSDPRRDHQTRSSQWITRPSDPHRSCLKFVEPQVRQLERAVDNKKSPTVCRGVSLHSQGVAETLAAAGGGRRPHGRCLVAERSSRRWAGRTPHGQHWARAIQSGTTCEAPSPSPRRQVVYTSCRRNGRASPRQSVEPYSTVERHLCWSERV